MLLNGDNGRVLDHHFVRVAPDPYCLVLVLEGNNVGMEHIETRGLVCSTKRLEILPDVCKGLIGVCSIPLGKVLMIDVVIMIALPHLLKVHLVDIPLVNKVKCWM